MAVKDQYDPKNIFSSYHFAGADESVVKYDVAHCPSECRRQNLGCTNIPPTMTCAPIPSYYSIPKSAEPAPHSCIECNHEITIVLQNDSSGQEMGSWIVMTDDGSCGPISSQPEMIYSQKMVVTSEMTNLTIPKICSGAEYQIGVFFPSVELTGETCCTSGGSMLYVDEVLIDASVDYQTVYNFVVPQRMEACSVVENSPCDSDCSEAVPSSPETSQRTKVKKTVTNQSEIALQTQSSVSRRDAALVATLENLFEEMTSNFLEEFLVTTNRMIATVRDRSFGNGYSVCQMVDALNDVSQAVRGVKVIEVSALSDGCNDYSGSSPMTMLHRKDEMRTQYAAHNISNVEFSTSSLRSKRSLLKIKRSGFQSFDESFVVELLTLVDIDGNDHISMMEMFRGSNILSEVISRMTQDEQDTSERKDNSPCLIESSRQSPQEVTARSSQPEFQGLGTITHIRGPSLSSDCILPANTFTSRCVATCSDSNEDENEDEDAAEDAIGLPFSPFC